MQLAASVLALLFVSASAVHLAERMPWHEALYFVTTTLTTVGFGDVVVRTAPGAPAGNHLRATVGSALRQRARQSASGFLRRWPC